MAERTELLHTFARLGSGQRWQVLRRAKVPTDGLRIEESGLVEEFMAEANAELVRSGVATYCPDSSLTAFGAAMLDESEDPR